MVSCLAALHVWTLNEDIVTDDKSIGISSYHEKKKEKHLDPPYCLEKANFVESRDALWTVHNKRPGRLKDCLKEFEDLLLQSPVVTCKWRDRQHFIIVLASATVVTFKISSHTGDVDKLVIDKSLVNKLSGENASDVLYADTFMVFCYPDKTKLDVIYFNKRLDIAKKLDKLSSYEPKISQVDLVGPLNRKLDRKLDCSCHDNIVLVWWSNSGTEAWPWSPMTSEKERANLALYMLKGASLEIMAYICTEGDPLSLEFSSLSENQIFSVEQSQCGSDDFAVSLCVYEFGRGRIHKHLSSSIHVKAKVTCVARSPREDRTLLACDDGTIILFDEYRKSSRLFHSCMKPSKICWHPNGVIGFVSSVKGEIQVFDLALSPLSVQLVAENRSPAMLLDLNKYFRSQPRLMHVVWNPRLTGRERVIPECRDSIAIVCERGPVMVMQLFWGASTEGQWSPVHLVNDYVTHREIDQALRVLNTLNWNVEGDACFSCMTSIVNFLLRNGLNPKSEEQLECALAAFYAPVKPLAESVVLEHRDAMSRLARRFFHQLLRHARFEKAFLLAVDIGSKDLFMDISYMAMEKKEFALAEVARQKADDIHERTLATDCGYDEYDDESGSSSRLDDDALYDDDDTFSSDDDYYCDDVMPPVLPPRAPVAPRAAADVTLRELPPPPPPEFAYPPLDGRFQSLRQSPVKQRLSPAHGYVSSADALVQLAETKLNLKSHNEYTATLLDDDAILPPPASHADASTASLGHSAQHKPAKIKVIHFGIV